MCQQYASSSCPPGRRFSILCYRIDLVTKIVPIPASSKGVYAGYYRTIRTLSLQQDQSYFRPLSLELYIREGSKNTVLLARPSDLRATVNSCVF